MSTQQKQNKDGVAATRRHLQAAIESLTVTDAHLARLTELLDGTSFKGARAGYDRAAVDLAVTLARLDRVLAIESAED